MKLQLFDQPWDISSFIRGNLIFNSEHLDFEIHVSLQPPHCPYFDLVVLETVFLNTKKYSYNAWLKIWWKHLFFQHRETMFSKVAIFKNGIKYQNVHILCSNIRHFPSAFIFLKWILTLGTKNHTHTNV